MFDLTGKHAIVTGGGSGIGNAIARRFHAAGAEVLVADINDCAAEVESWGGHFRRTDVGDPAEVTALFDRAMELFGSLEIAVNNAGIGLVATVEQVGGPDSDRLHRINTLGMLNGMREAALRMTSGGSIISTASIAGGIGIPGILEYSMGKAAIIQATKVAALDLGARNIRVNAISPGAIETPLTANSDAPLLALAPHITALGRAGQPEEIAALAHFLASDDASYITGQAIFADGGWNIGTTLQTLITGVEKAGTA